MWSSINYKVSVGRGGGGKVKQKISIDCTDVSFDPSCIFELGCYSHGQNLATNFLRYSRYKYKFIDGAIFC